MKIDVIDPKRTAMIVVDMQNDFVAAGAAMETPSARAVVPRLAEALNICRDALLTFSLFCPLLFCAIPTYSTNQTQKSSDQSRLAREAEKNRFTIRRVEFCCNLEVRDEVLRKRITLIEGEIFKKALLERSISRLNTLKLIKPVTLKNVVVRLDRENKHIDFTFFLEQ